MIYWELPAELLHAFHRAILSDGYVIITKIRYIRGFVEACPAGMGAQAKKTHQNYTTEKIYLLIHAMY